MGEEKWRLRTLKELAAGKRVLDVGCVDHEAYMEERGEWLHGILAKVAREITGLDFEAEEVAKLNARGYQIIHGDAEIIDLGKSYELVVAGELIEHLENPGKFLRNMLRHLNPGAHS